MNNNPLISSIDSSHQITNDREKSSPINPQKFSHSLDKTLIKFNHSMSFDSVPPSIDIPSPIVQAMQGLVQIIAHLRSPNGSWPSNLPQTPENLIPYVTEEVSDVLVAYQKYTISTAQNIPSFCDTKDLKLQPSVILFLNTLISQLLWNLAQSSYQLMRLLTGINAEILLPDQDWVQGKLRLVACLMIKNDNLYSLIDLATNDFPPPLITSEAYVQSNDCSFCQHPLEIQSFLKQIIQHIENNCPTLNLLTDPIKTTFLSPHNQWEPIEISIDLGFQFIPDPKTSEVSPFPHSLDHIGLEEDLFKNTPIQDIEYSILSSVPKSSLLEMNIRLTDPKIILPYIQTQMQHYGLQELPQKKKLQLADSGNSCLEEKLLNLDHQEETDIIELIQIADELVDVIYNPKSPSSLIELKPEIPLIDLSLRLLWQIIKSRYNIMQLMSGIPAKILQPGFEWQTGTLRLLAVLSAEFLNDSWELDIATCQPLQFDLNPISTESIIQSDWIEWCRSPQSLDCLKLQIINILETVPELKSWMKKVKIEESHSDASLELSNNWQSGLAQLSFDFEWISGGYNSSEENSSFYF